MFMVIIIILIIIKNVENDDNDEQKYLCNECFYIIIENLNYIFSSKAFREDKYFDIKKVYIIIYYYYFFYE